MLWTAVLLVCLGFWGFVFLLGFRVCLFVLIKGKAFRKLLIQYRNKELCRILDFRLICHCLGCLTWSNLLSCVFLFSLTLRLFMHKPQSLAAFLAYCFLFYFTFPLLTGASSYLITILEQSISSPCKQITYQTLEPCNCVLTLVLLEVTVIDSLQQCHTSLFCKCSSPA